MIDAAFRARADVALAELERREGVRVLLAVESGSRAWGFPSRDSDYDVRFLYRRPLDDYLRIVPPQEVLERPIDDLLDLGGWDLRKALGLIVRSNAVALEWLRSPIVYRRSPPSPTWPTQPRMCLRWPITTTVWHAAPGRPEPTRRSG